MDRLATRLDADTKFPVAVVVIMVADAFALICAMALALVLHFDQQPVWQVFKHNWYPHLLSTPLVILMYLCILYAFRLYRYAWRFASLEMIWGVVSANSVGIAGMIVLQKLIDESTFSRSVFFIFWLLSIFFVGGVRIMLRLANLGRSHGLDALRNLRGDVRPRRVVILGGGADGARLLGALREDVLTPYDVIGFLDNTPNKHGIYIRGVRVLGPLKHLYTLLADHAVDEVLIATTNSVGTDMREYVMACRKQQVPVKMIPGLSDVLAKKTLTRLEEISVEDLLRRPPICIDLAEIGKYLTGKSVLVSGAGGSIGSELCRQIIALNPSRLVLLGHGENSIHLIHKELCHLHPAFIDRLFVTIGSISDDVRMNQVFREHQPVVVFHAAAHKHVPIMEVNVHEAVQNNVLGTRCIAETCGRNGVERMVLISTDKAVYPSSVMGATKWLCEEVTRAMAKAYPATTYVTVRFGNVLGSRGSVVPIFREQIMRGGPVTITHPQITRFFMTIPEAVQLVLQAGAIGESGELYLLDMGTPIKIVDLAHDMIRLCGLEPEKDIPVVFTGLRAGEKLHELLITNDESLAPSPCKGFSIVTRPTYFTPPELLGILRKMQQLATTSDGDALLDYLGEVVPSFASQRLLAEAISSVETPEIITRS